MRARVGLSEEIDLLEQILQLRKTSLVSETFACIENKRTMSRPVNYV